MLLNPRIPSRLPNRLFPTAAQAWGRMYSQGRGKEMVSALATRGAAAGEEPRLSGEGGVNVYTPNNGAVKAPACSSQVLISKHYTMNPSLSCPKERPRKVDFEGSPSEGSSRSPYNGAISQHAALCSESSRWGT